MVILVRVALTRRAVGIRSCARQPVDRDVFMRALRYHEIRSGKTP